MTGFFAPDAEGFTEDGTRLRTEFYASWDAMAEYWFDSVTDFCAARKVLQNDSAFAEGERALLDASFWRLVDETVAVLPNRAPPPNYYFR